MQTWSLPIDPNANLEAEIARVFGEGATFFRVDKWTLVHLDNPTPEEIERRAVEFDPAEIFNDDCPLCRMLREDGGAVIFNGC